MSASDLLSFAACTDHLAGTGANADLEDILASVTGFAHALGMSSASTALDFASRDAFDPGDEVIVPSIAAGETIAPLLRRGCVVVFADVHPATLTIDPEAARRLITPRTRGLVGVDIAGWPHDTAALRAIADEAGLSYLADLAQGFGARSHGRHSGYAADTAVLSLNAQKTLQAGEGGVLLTNDTALFQRALRETQHPHRQARELGTDAINYFATNGRLSALAATAALHNLPPAIDRIHQQRQHARAIIEVLNTLGLVEPLTKPNDCDPTYPYLTAAWRAQPLPVALLSALHDAGHPVRMGTPPLRPLHKHPQVQQAFARQVRIPRALPNTERAEHRFSIHFGDDA